MNSTPEQSDRLRWIKKIDDTHLKTRYVFTSDGMETLEDVFYMIDWAESYSDAYGYQILDNMDELKDRLKSLKEIIKKFQEENPTKDDKIKALQAMTDEEIDVLIRACGNIQAKIFYSSYKTKTDNADTPAEEQNKYYPFRTKQERDAFIEGVIQGEVVDYWPSAAAKMRRLEERARHLAREQFAGRTDKAGVDYYEGHLTSVAALVDGDEKKTVAYLHDILEDTDYPEDKLREEFGDRIVDALLLVTHKGHLDDEGYLNYIRKLKESGNELAIAVKIADLTNNSDCTRLGVSSPDDLPEEDRKRWEKYQKSLRILQDESNKEV